MKQKPAVFLLAFSILAYAFLIAFAAYRIVALRSNGIEESERDFISLRRLAGSALAQGKEIGSKIFLEQMRTRYAASPRLVALSVRDISGKLEYAIPATSVLTAPPPEKSKLPRFVSDFLAKAFAFSIHRQSSPIGLPDTRGMSIEAVHTALPTGLVLVALRDSLIGMVGLVFISGIILLIVALTEDESEASQEPARESIYESALSSVPRTQGLTDEFQVPAFNMDDSVQLRPENGPRGLYSPRSGLGWESYLLDRLDAELSRCASLGLDCAFILMNCGTVLPGDPAYRDIAASIKDFFSFKDISFERGDSGFAVILPGKDIEQALKAARDFRGALPADVRIGLSSRSGRLVDSSVIIKEAEAAMERAGASGDSPVVGFKADPDLYRNFISGKL